MDDLLDEVLADDGLPPAFAEGPTNGHEADAAEAVGEQHAVPAEGGEGQETEETAQGVEVAVNPELTATQFLQDVEGQGSAIKVTIDEFEPVMGKMCYLVCTETTLGHFAKRKMKATRKYEDFQWLHDRFSECADLAGILIPHLPPKVVWYNVNEKESVHRLSGFHEGLAIHVQDEFHKRARQLTRWLQRVCNLPQLHDDPNLQVFLEYAEELNIRPTTSLFGSFFKPAVRRDPDPEFEAIRLRNDDYKARITQANERCSVMINTGRRFGHQELVVMGSMPTARKSVEHERQLAKLFDAMGRGLLRAQEHAFLLAEGQEACLLDVLSDYTGACAAVESMLLRRSSLSDRKVQAIRSREKAEGKLAKAGTTLDEREEEVKACKEVEEETKQLFRQASSSALKNYKRSTRQRLLEFKQALVALAELEIQIANDSYRRWAEVATLIRRV